MRQMTFKAPLMFQRTTEPLMVPLAKRSGQQVVDKQDIF